MPPDLGYMTLEQTEIVNILQTHILQQYPQYSRMHRGLHNSRKFARFIIALNTLNIQLLDHLCKVTKEINIPLADPHLITRTTTLVHDHLGDFQAGNPKNA